MSQFECIKCKNTYPNHQDFFVKEKRSKSGFSNLCKNCKRESDKEYRNKYKTEISERRKLKYANDKKPISHEIYVNQTISDPIAWRAIAIRNGMVVRSKKNNLDFDKEYFTIDRIKILIIEQKKCPCCNVNFSCEPLLNGIKNNHTPSVDRFDNNQGYTKINTVFLCWRCNNLKRDSSIDDLQRVIDWLEIKLIRL